MSTSMMGMIVPKLKLLLFEALRLPCFFWVGDRLTDHVTDCRRSAVTQGCDTAVLVVTSCFVARMALQRVSRT